MGIDSKQVGVQIRKFVAFFIRTSRLVFNHPFIVGFLCFSMLLYRSFPLLFSFLISTSPVLVCTAVLLGTLLSFGKPNVPEIDEQEEKLTTYEVANLKTGFVEGDSVFVESDRNVDFAEVGIYGGKLGDDSMERVSLVENRVEEDGSAVECKPLVEENSRELKFEKGGVDEEVKRGFDHLDSEKEREILVEETSIGEGSKNEEVIVSLSPKGRDEDLGMEGDKSPRELMDTNKEDQLNSWKRIGEESGDEDGDDVDKFSDSGSDGAESSSPDASMADIIPMLDELHPLLDMQAPQRALLSRNESDVASESSHKSDEDSGDDSVDYEDSEHHEDGVEGEDDNDVEEEGEEVKGGKEDESKSAIKWTEVDQRNLMDLGTLELERNQRLENLIARRRARQVSRLMAEKNLIDLDGSDFPSHIPSISTTRRNPFDDYYDDIAIPGSAPSILLPRRNPFDIPYDSNEEKPDLKGDGFEQEFSVVQQKEPIYRRNETFNVGASIFGGPKQEKIDFKWKPYFVPERMVSDEGTSYSPFQRQFSDNSESKLSSVTSVPESESASSEVDDEEKKGHEQSALEDVSYAAIQRQSSELSDLKVCSVTDTESVNSAADEEDKKLHEQSVTEETSSPTIQRQISEVSEVKSIPDMDDEDKRHAEEDISSETEAISDADHVADLVKHGSQSSEDSYSVDIEQEDKRGVSHDEVKNHPASEYSLSGTGDSSTPSAPSTNEIRPKTEQSEEEFGSVSTSSQLSQEDERSSVKGRSASLEIPANSINRTGSSQTSLVESESQLLSRGIEQKEPVYDSSPPPLETFLSFASISTELQQEIYEMASCNPLPLPLPSFKLSGSESLGIDMEDMNVASSPKVRGADKSGVVNTGRDLSSGMEPAEEYTVYKGEHFVPKSDQVSKEIDSKGKDDQNASTSSLSAPEGLQQPVAIEEQEKDHGQSGKMDDTVLHQEKDAVMLPVDLTPKDGPAEVRAPSKLENQMVEKIAEPCFDSPSEPPQEAPAIFTKSLGITENANVSEVDDRDQSSAIPSTDLGTTSSVGESPDYGSPNGKDVHSGIHDGIIYEDRGYSGDSLNDSAEVYRNRDDEEETINVEADEIKDIDEGLLSELDTVGDFSIVGHTVEANTSNSSLNSTYTNPQLPVLEARSALDIDMAFKQLHEGADVEEVILPSMLGDQISSNGSKDPASHLPVVEARSLEDIHAALKQASESNSGENLKLAESEETTANQMDAGSGSVEISKPSESKAEEKEETGTGKEIKPSDNLAEVPEQLKLNDVNAEVESKDGGTKVE